MDELLRLLKELPAPVHIIISSVAAAGGIYTFYKRTKRKGEEEETQVAKLKTEQVKQETAQKVSNLELKHEEERAEKWREFSDEQKARFTEQLDEYKNELRELREAHKKEIQDTHTLLKQVQDNLATAHYELNVQQKTIKVLEMENKALTESFGAKETENYKLKQQLGHEALLSLEARQKFENFSIFIQTIDVTNAHNLPKIELSEPTHILRCYGESKADNTSIISLFHSVKAALTSYFERNHELRFIVNMPYMNTVTAHCLEELFEEFERQIATGKNVEVVWQYEKGDPDGRDEGSVFAGATTIPFSFYEYERDKFAK